MGPPVREGKGLMANVLPMGKRIEVIAHLCEGAGIRPTVRLTDVSKPTISSLLLAVGAGCDRLHDRLVNGLDIREIQCDEIWSFIRKKQARVKLEDDPTWGDCYTFLGIARTQKIVVSYRVGKRDDAHADAFMADLRARLVTVPLICTDGFAPYRTAIGKHFETVDYSVVQKNYSRSPRRVRDGQPSDHRYEPPRDPFITRIPVYGVPDMGRCSTSHVERANLEVRMNTRRFTRLCNGFSRSLPHMMAAVALWVAYTNFCKIHGALRCTPAQEAGVASTVWSVAELVEAALAEPAGEKSVKTPLALPEQHQGAVRELAGGGFLRAVPGGDAPPPPPVTPIPTPAALAAKGPRPMVQLTLFPPEGGES